MIQLQISALESMAQAAGVPLPFARMSIVGYANADRSIVWVNPRHPQYPGSSPPAPIAQATPASGPGTELSKLLKRFGINPTPTCQCRDKAAEMDAWGCDECEKPHRIEEVVAVMREEAKARGLPFLDAAGRMLVRRAIANARRAASRQVADPAPPPPAGSTR